MRKDSMRASNGKLCRVNRARVRSLVQKALIGFSKSQQNHISSTNKVPCTNFRDRGLIGFWALMNEEFEGPEVDDVPITSLCDMQVVVMAVGGGTEEGVDSSVESKGSEELQDGVIGFSSVGKLPGWDAGIERSATNCSFEHGVKDMIHCNCSSQDGVESDVKHLIFDNGVNISNSQSIPSIGIHPPCHSTCKTNRCPAGSPTSAFEIEGIGRRV